MLHTITKKMMFHPALVLITLLTLSSTSYGAVLFEDSFDKLPDWNMDGSKVECNSGTCSDAPANWTYYRQTNGFGQPTARIFNQADHTTGSGKSYIVYSESDPNANWPSDAQLSKVFTQDYPELYWRAWIKTQSNWQSAASSEFKVLRTTHYDRIGNYYEYFGSGSASTIFLMELGTSALHGTDFVPAYRCDPQSTNYYCPQSPYDNDYFTKLGATVQGPTTKGMYADGEWHRYDFHVKMNTQTGNTWNKDGIAEFWYDGVLKSTHNDVQWKYPGSDTSIGWNSIGIGGNANNSFSSQGEQWYAVDDVVVSTTPIPADYAIGGATAADTTSPTVSISSPTNNATVSGTVSITANASDNVGVAKVEYYVNNALKSTVTSSPYVYSWDTSTVAAGTYSLMTKAYDAAGNISQSSTVSVSVVKDTTIPTASLTAPTNNAIVSGTIAITANATDNVGVSKVEFYSNGTLLAAGNVAPYSYSWNTTSVANGVYALTVKAYDASNNVVQSAAVSVTVNNVGPDTSAPAVSIASPAANSTVSGNVLIAASVSDNVGVTKVEYYVNGGLDNTLTAAPFSYSVPTTVAQNGTYSMYAKAYDAAGNMKQSPTISFTINNTSTAADTTAPTVSIVSPTANATVSGTVTIAAAATDNIGVSKVEYYVNGGLDNTLTVAPFSYSVPTTVAHNGTYTMYAKAYDAAGNVKQSPTINFTIYNTVTPVADTTVPTASITSPAANATVSGTVTIAAAATDNIGVSKVEFYINGSLKGTDTGSPYSYSWNTTSVSDGSYAITTKAYDAAGNVKQSSAVSVTVKNLIVVTPPIVTADTTAPTVRIASPLAYSTVSGTVKVAVTASDNVGVTKVVYYVNGGIDNTLTVAPFSYSVPTTAAQNGTYTMYAKAYDAAGNMKQSARIKFTIKN